MEFVKMMALEAINKGFKKVGAQEYKWISLVIDEETGDVMNLKKTSETSKI